MTQRTENPPPSPIEQATMDTMHDLNSAITHEHRASAVPVTEKEFRRIIAGYFERQSLREWHELLGIEPPKDT